MCRGTTSYVTGVGYSGRTPSVGAEGTSGLIVLTASVRAGEPTQPTRAALGQPAAYLCLE